MFIGDGELKAKLPENVLTKGHTKYIKSKTEKILIEKEVYNIVDGIKAYRLPSSFKTRRKHIQHVKVLKKINFEVNLFTKENDLCLRLISTQL